MEYDSDMVRLTDFELSALHSVASEIRSFVEELAHTVDTALDQHESFRRTKVPSSDLERALVMDGARRGASRAGLSSRDESNGLEVISTANLTERYFRVKRVTVKADGEVDAICGRGSSLLVREPDTLMVQEKWILGFTTDDDHTIDRLFVAEVRDWLETGPGPVHLVLGPIIDLTTGTPPRGFTSTDEDLEGFEDEEGMENAG